MAYKMPSYENQLIKQHQIKLCLKWSKNAAKKKFPHNPLSDVLSHIVYAMTLVADTVKINKSKVVTTFLSFHFLLFVVSKERKDRQKCKRNQNLPTILREWQCTLRGWEIGTNHIYSCSSYTTAAGLRTRNCTTTL